MTKKAHFIIPTVLIKQAAPKIPAVDRVLKQLTQQAARSGPFTRNSTEFLTPTGLIQPGSTMFNTRTGAQILDKVDELEQLAKNTAKGSEQRAALAKELRSVRNSITKPTTTWANQIRPGSAPSAVSRAAALNLKSPVTALAGTLDDAGKALASVTDDAGKALAGTADDAAKAVSPTAVQTAAAKEPNKYLEDLKGFLRTRTGRIAAPSAAAIGGLMYGRSGGYDKGFGEGTLAAQQMAAIQAMQMQQQARQMYDNQGIIDRVMGRNPF